MYLNFDKDHCVGEGKGHVTTSLGFLDKAL